MPSWGPLCHICWPTVPHVWGTVGRKKYFFVTALYQNCIVFFSSYCYSWCGLHYTTKQIKDGAHSLINFPVMSTKPKIGPLCPTLPFISLGQLLDQYGRTVATPRGGGLTPSPIFLQRWLRYCFDLFRKAWLIGCSVPHLQIPVFVLGRACHLLTVDVAQLFIIFFQTVNTSNRVKVSFYFTNTYARTLQINSAAELE